MSKEKVSKEYQFEEDEIVLFRARCVWDYTGSLLNRYNGEVILTNKNLVIYKSFIKLFTKPENNIIVHPISDITIYNDKPQVKVKLMTCELYVKNIGYRFNFSMALNDATKFSNAIMELLTGKTFTDRSAEKVKGTINLVDNTLGINSVETTVDVLKNGLAKTSFRILKKKTKPNSLLNKAAKFLDNNTDIIRNDEVVSDDSMDDNIDKVKKLKELLDQGILTQEEFDKKKKQLLKL